MSQQSDNGQSKWQLAFWIITVICGVCILALAEGMVTNDRDSRSRDDVLKLCIDNKFEQIIGQFVGIKEDIREIKTKLQIYGGSK